MKQSAIIFDIDGTLADFQHRRHHVEKTPKDWKAFFADMHSDKPLPTASIARAMNQDYTIIMVTGREEIHRLPTIEWLRSNYIPCDELYMRPNKNRQDDDIVKRDIYIKHIEPYYDVRMVFEDRKRIKRMWVELGLFVLDCNQNDVEF